MTETSISTSALPAVLGEAFPNTWAATRDALVAAAGVRRLGSGQILVRQGDDSFLALVIEGHVAVRRTTIDGRQLIVRIITRGQLAPILPLAARPASADAVALTHGTAAVWRGEEVRTLAAADPGLGLDLLDNVLGFFEDLVGRIDSLHYQDAPRRVARVLYTKADLFFADPPVLTRAHLPTLVGTSREMTGRVLRVLESQGLVARVGRDRLRVLNLAGLAAVAESGVDGPLTARMSSESRVARHLR